ncbi:hypothetical protein U5801_27540 [Lamprobacter modestohalophilus]|uniref:hypothetical protein n=1 Tax=Lamprobacter modestohalophilus TaxID=1064514 RepID=UPI002ADEF997|nr:hypothetical protein [Lamprobacter modestohalophilus]MEA1053529.1 hypothetical protein [Lamprobacter modestohalophilus]
MDKTLQDPVVKELRPEGIKTLDAANGFLPGFMDGFETKFARKPASDKDLHRSLTELYDLDDILCWQEEHTVAHCDHLADCNIIINGSAIHPHTQNL